MWKCDECVNEGIEEIADFGIWRFWDFFWQ